MATFGIDVLPGWDTLTIALELVGYVYLCYFSSYEPMLSGDRKSSLRESRLNKIGADKREIFWQTNWNLRQFTASVDNFSLGFPK